MKNKFLSIAIGALALASAPDLSGQDLLVEYNYMQDQFKYYRLVGASKKKVEVSRPVVKKNYQVKVEVINFNPFLYTSNCDFTQTTVKETPSSAAGLSSLLPMSSFGGGGITSFLQKLNMNQKSEEEGVRALNFLTGTNALLYAEVKTNYNKLADIESKLNLINYADIKLKGMLYNPYIEPDSIKSLCSEFMYTIFKHSAQSATAFYNEISTINTDYQDAKVGFENSSSNFMQAYENYSNSHPGADFGGKNSFGIVKGYQSKVSLLTSKIESVSIQSEMDSLEYTYRSIMNTPFRYTASSRAKEDEILVKLDFYENSRYMLKQGGGFTAAPNTNRLDTLKKTRTRSVEVSVAGDMKISTSIGLGFPTYFGANKDYSNRDSVITSSPGSNYTPHLTTMLSFYPYNGRNASFGGSFGVGVPLEDEKATNFFIGLSSILGANNKVVISGGLCIGKANVLQRGYKDGDKLTSADAIIPVERKYKTGAFFSVSFALGALTK